MQRGTAVGPSGPAAPAHGAPWAAEGRATDGERGGSRRRTRLPSPIVAKAARLVPGEDRLLTSQEARALIAAAPPHVPTGARNRALLAMMYRSGLRPGEAVALAGADLDPVAGVVVVRSGRRPAGRRTTGVDATTRDLVRAWLELRRARGIPERAPLFCTLGGQAADRRPPAPDHVAAGAPGRGAPARAPDGPALRQRGRAGRRGPARAGHRAPPRPRAVAGPDARPPGARGRGRPGRRGAGVGGPAGTACGSLTPHHPWGPRPEPGAGPGWGVLRSGAPGRGAGPWGRLRRARRSPADPGGPPRGRPRSPGAGRQGPRRRWARPGGR